MKALIGAVIILIGIACGIYFGIFVLFIGGVLQFIKGLSPVSPVDIAWGIIKVFLSGITGWGIFGICSFVGSFLISEN